jgi:hypothetical protein|tara:strand:+ start:2985 stop:3674 length:690 start_codon:yes stop_codon:yes gene_type:complete
MFNKEIKFIIIDKALEDIVPHPEPASRFIPEEYKKLERFIDGDLHKATVKTCIPFLDSLTAGYIIPFDQDYLVDPVENDFSIIPANREAGDVGAHDNFQLPKEWSKMIGKTAGKFMNKWLIKTPPGYSCLFVHPFNRFSDQRFEIISGIVDTDTYINAINFPFLLKKRDEQFLFKKGDPMVQLIPFKRERWKKWSGFYMERLHREHLTLLLSKWIDRYKNFFWQKKHWK